jgi:hypothetical protein
MKRAHIVTFCLSTTILLFIPFFLHPEEIKFSGGNDYDYSVGCYYFGYWFRKPMGRDVPMDLLVGRWNERKPLLGWYLDTPYTMKWEVKRALRGGIHFFAFLWYYLEEDTASTDTLRDSASIHSSLNGAFRSFLATNDVYKMKFCVVYTNHDHFGVPPSQWDRYATYWAKLMLRDDYFKIALKGGEKRLPLFIVWSPSSLQEHWRGQQGGASEAIRRLRQIARRVGVGEIAIGGCIDHSNPEVWDEGYDIITGYNFHSSGGVPPGKVGKYDYLAKGHLSIWDSMTTLGKPVIPVITSGWDPRPWPGTAKGSPYYPDRTPKKFKIFCRLARDWIGSNEKSVVVPKTVLIYAWNELGEGGYILPTVGEGYGYLKAIKEVFGKENSSRK